MIPKPDKNGRVAILAKLECDLDAPSFIQGIIEGDQIQVAAFSLENFSYLTGLTLGQ